MKRRVLCGCAIALAALAVFVVAGEALLRASGFNAPIWYQPDPQLGWTMRPHAEGWSTKEGRGYAQISAAGFRDRGHALDKPPGVYRIAVIGDSVVEALQVDVQDTFWRQLQEGLRGCPALGGHEVEVMGFGVAGYGTAQEYLMLRSRVLPYRPDLVLLAFAPNDLQDNSARLAPEHDRPYFVPDGEGLRLDDSFTRLPQFRNRSSALYEVYRSASDWLRLVQLVQAARSGVSTLWQASAAQAAAAGKDRQGIEPLTIVSLFAPPRSPAWEEAWTVTERLIARINDDAAQQNARLAITVLTHSAQVDPDPGVRRQLEQLLGVGDLFYIDRRLQALGEREGIAVISLAPELQKRAEAEHIHFHGFSNYRVGWGHWNAEGHRAAATIIASRLCSHGLLSSPSTSPREDEQ